MISDALAFGFINALKEATSFLKDAIAVGEISQKISLGLGRNFDTINKELAPSIKGLRGTLDQKIGAGLLAVEAGLNGNVTGITKLINQQQLTAGNFRITAASLAKLESTLGISREATNSLAENLLETGADYKISTVNLVKTIDSLKNTFVNQKLAGYGDAFIKSVTKLQGEFGPQLMEELNSFLNLVLDPGMESFQRLSLAGIGDIRERLSMAKNNEALISSILKEGISKLNKAFLSVAGNAESQFVNIGIATDIFGEAAKNATVLHDSLNKRMVEREKTELNYGRTISNLIKEVFVPLKESILTNYYPSFLKLSESLLVSSKNLVEQYTPKITSYIDIAGEKIKTFITDTAKLYNSFGGLEGAILKTQIGFKEFVLWLDSIRGIDLFSKSEEERINLAKTLFENINSEFAKNTLRDYGIYETQFKRFLPDYEAYKQRGETSSYNFNEFIKRVASFFDKPERERDLFKQSLTELQLKYMDVVREGLEKNEDPDSWFNKIAKNSLEKAIDSDKKLGQIVQNTTPKQELPFVNFIKDSNEMISSAVEKILNIENYKTNQEVVDLLGLIARNTQITANKQPSVTLPFNSVGAF